MEMWFSEFHTPDVKHSIRVNRQLYSKQSDYQRIDIFETPEFGRVLTLDGNVMLTERDEFIYDEMITHVPIGPTDFGFAVHAVLTSLCRLIHLPIVQHNRQKSKPGRRGCTKKGSARRSRFLYIC